MSWRAQALVWPGVCALLYIGSIAWRFNTLDEIVLLAVIVPIAAVASAFVFGGVAVATALGVRKLVRMILPGLGFRVFQGLLALTTAVVLFAFTWGASGALLNAHFTSNAIGKCTAAAVIAAIASSVYARRLFDEQVEGRGPESV